ncbi:unnamed protein product, partial [Discosporangium mesarthrocarpum]
EEADHAWATYLAMKGNNTVVATFGMQIQKSVKCLFCHNTRWNFEGDTDLRVPLPAAALGLEAAAAVGPGIDCSLKDCIQACFKEVSGARFCPKCDGFTSSTTTNSIYRFPRILVIQVNRSTGYNEMQKLNNRLSFPLQGLDLQPFLAPGAHATAAPGLGGGQRPKGSSTARGVYDLVGVANHFGQTLENGHYVAQCRRRDGKWWTFNDAAVSSGADFKSEGSREAQVLFYALQEDPVMGAGGKG